MTSRKLEEVWVKIENYHGLEKKKKEKKRKRKRRRIGKTNTKICMWE